MIERYSNRTIFNNSQDMYKNLLNNRNLKNIKQYETVNYTIDFSSIAQNMQIINHVWSLGDRYYKISNKYYGDPKDWWVIALYNTKPTESNILVGDIIYVPTPLIKLLNYIKY